MNLSKRSIIKVFIAVAILTGISSYFFSLNTKQQYTVSEENLVQLDVGLDSQLSICFTPNQKCQNMIVSAIEAAKKSVLIQAYSFTDPIILKALDIAKLRGVDIKLLVDKSVIKSKSSPFYNAECPFDIKIDRTAGLAHNKIMIIDSEQVITGSYNFSKAAYLKNAENLLFITNLKIAKIYEANFLMRWKKAIPPNSIALFIKSKLTIRSKS